MDMDADTVKILALARGIPLDADEAERLRGPLASLLGRLARLAQSLPPETTPLPTPIVPPEPPFAATEIEP